MKIYYQNMLRIGLLIVLLSCQQSESPEQVANESQISSLSEQQDKVFAGDSQNSAIRLQGKPVVYQVLTRLFGNQKSTNKPWGTIEENGVGKFNDFTDKALQGIKQLGVTHLWFTGVPHHALIGDYSQYGISNDDPDVVKGRAGSPYAVKDYYNVDPDLAVDPDRRLQEFKALVERTHNNGMKVIIDIVPNHVARNYHSISKPEGVTDFGENDNTSVEYARDNNFYYVVGEPFVVPQAKDGYKPLGGEKHPLADGRFEENPAKWTGNGSRKSQPDINDWYETVKINYGVKPDGSYDFVRLPEDFRTRSTQQHYEFWQDKSVPDSWLKFRDIALYWIDFGVDGFRFDVAELVPVEFWSYLNSAIKQKNPDAFLLAEVYNRAIYHDFIQLGKMDYLYDKVDLYDTLKLVMQGKAKTSSLLPIVEKYSDIESHQLHFLENHDEQRIASADFAGNAEKGRPGMVVSALLGKGPIMLYFAQEFGDAGNGDAGFGDPSRTTIFDYWGIDSLQRWNNKGKFDNEKLTPEEKALRQYYVRLLNYSANSSAVTGAFADLHQVNLASTKSYDESLFSFVRWTAQEKIIVVNNFSDTKNYQLKLKVPASVIESWQLTDGEFLLSDIISDEAINSAKETTYRLSVTNGQGEVNISLSPLESLVLQLN